VTILRVYGWAMIVCGIILMTVVGADAGFGTTLFLFLLGAAAAGLGVFLLVFEHLAGRYRG
jgi:hypothetical protein